MYHHPAQFQGKRPAHHRDPPPSTTARRDRGVSVVGGPKGNVRDGEEKKSGWVMCGVVLKRSECNC